MSAREPPEMAQVAADTGAKKVHRTWDRVLVSAFLAGAYISFGALVAITVSSGWIRDLGHAAHPLHGRGVHPRPGPRPDRRLDLATGNIMLVPLSAMRGKISVSDVVSQPDAGAPRQPSSERCSWRSSSPSRPTSSATPDIRRATRCSPTSGWPRSRRGRPATRAWGTFLRGVGCNWLVCLAVWMSLAATVGVGQDPRRLLPGHGLRRDGLRPRRRQHVLHPGGDLRRRARTSAGATPSGTGCSPGLGNLVGAVVFVATSYWYLFLKDTAGQGRRRPQEPAERA